MTRGTSEPVTFTSEPTGARVTTTTGLECPATPCTHTVDRKSEFLATFELPGYEKKQISVGTRLATGGAVGLAGNVLVGGVLGMSVDVLSGATLEHNPNPVFALLDPVGGKKAAPVAQGKPKPKRAKAFKPDPENDAAKPSM